MEELTIAMLLSEERTFQADRGAKASCESVPGCLRTDWRPGGSEVREVFIL